MPTSDSPELRMLWDAELRPLLNSERLGDLRWAAAIAMAFPKLLTSYERARLRARGERVTDVTENLVEAVHGCHRPDDGIGIEISLWHGADPHAAFLNDGVPLLCSLTERHTPAGINGPWYYDRLKTQEAVIMIYYDADLMATDPRNGRTPLHNAVSWSAENLARCLVDAGADPFARDHDGRTPRDLLPDNVDIACRETFDALLSDPTTP